jgi:hypothetical protein
MLFIPVIKYLHKRIVTVTICTPDFGIIPTFLDMLKTIQCCKLSWVPDEQENTYPGLLSLLSFINSFPTVQSGNYNYLVSLADKVIWAAALEFIPMGQVSGLSEGQKVSS